MRAAYRLRAIERRVGVTHSLRRRPPRLLENRCMSLRESFDQLSPAQQREVHLRLCAEALSAWQAHAAEHAPIRYADSVVGMAHVVEIDLPADALRSATAGEDLANVSARYTEPIV